MATGRQYLESIIQSCSVLQNMDDTALESIKDGLERLDGELDSAIDYVEN
jgi:hypothetical protein